MFRNQKRLRNQLNSRKFAEKREAELIKNKQELLKSIESNDVSALKKSALNINDAMAWDDAGADGILTNEDDEYQWAGVENPNVLITTARDPSSTLKQFSKELHHIIPNSQRMNRGNTTIEMITEKCLKEQITDLIILEEVRGVPQTLTISHFPHGPTVIFSLQNVTLRHQMNLETCNESGVKGKRKLPTQYPHLLFKGFTSTLGKRIQTILTYLFPVPKPDSNRIIGFYEMEDNISFNHITYKREHSKETGKTLGIDEHGPKFTLRLYKLFRGVLQQEPISDVEYLWKPYMNTSRKRNFLSE